MSLVHFLSCSKVGVEREVGVAVVSDLGKCPGLNICSTIQGDNLLALYCIDFIGYSNVTGTQFELFIS